MKRFFIAGLGIFLLTIGIVNAQNVGSGVNDIYAERYQSAKATFEKLVAANPNDIQSNYWLGQTYIGMNDIAGAKGIYDKALAASANAPLLLVGLGEVELNQNKINEARQHFETALTMAGSKKGGDPEVLNAVGRAISKTYTDKEKKGDINFAVQKLEEASLSKTKDNALLADVYLNLGNAYLKAKPGENGGPAFTSYQKAFEANPSFAVPYYRMAMLFKTQRNWELFEKYLNDAILKDPRFAPAYYELAYFKMLRLDLPAAEAFAKKFAEVADNDPQNEYLRASILWAQKNYDQALEVAKSIDSRLGERTNPRVYKLIAYSYLGKKDTATAKPYIDKYFTKVKPEDVVALDYSLKADVYSGIPGQEEVVFSSYLDGIKADTVVENKMDLLKKGAEFFQARKQYAKEAQLRQVILDTKPNVNINDIFSTTVAYYRGSENFKSYALAKTMAEKYPEQQFGWEWKYNNAILIDTVKKDSIAVPDALTWLTFAQKDTVKFGRQISSTSYFLATYYQDKDKTKAIEYLKIMKAATKDPATQENIQKNIDLLSKPPAPVRQQAPAKPKPGTPPAGTKPKTTVKKTTR
ncbi:MAG: tetratricopeptide repeat protein [Chitinophagaceae bacterium]